MPAALAPGEVHAQSGRGFYLSQELGPNFTPALDIEDDAPNAPGSICAEHLNPFTDLMTAFCGDPNAPGTSWTNTFDGAGGILAGRAAGYRFTEYGQLRVELEYFYRETAHNETSAAEGHGGVAVAKLDGEVAVGEDRIGSITSHNVFGNGYFDFTNRSRVTPYVGAGVGLTNLDGLLWVRNSDPDRMTSIVPVIPVRSPGRPAGGAARPRVDDHEQPDGARRETGGLSGVVRVRHCPHRIAVARRQGAPRRIQELQRRHGPGSRAQPRTERTARRPRSRVHRNHYRGTWSYTGPEPEVPVLGLAIARSRRLPTRPHRTA